MTQPSDMLLNVQLGIFILLSASLPRCTSASPTSFAFANDAANSTYDFVIVGGGTAGLTLASRLSENPEIHVLVIEAGGSPDITNPNSTIPALDLITLSPTSLDWNISTAPQANLNNRTIHYTRGKTLGGCSSVNYMIYTRGSSSLYDKWESMGNEGWGWDDVEPYFINSVHLTTNDNDTFNSSVYSPSGGPLQLSFNRYKQAFDYNLVNAMEELGLKRIDDFNDGNMIGVAPVTSTVDLRSGKGIRSSSYEAFYSQHVRERQNLHVWTGTRAEKVLISDLGGVKIAQGVQYTTQNASAAGGGTVFARKEVILSAGSLHTPQLLILSGIGPQSTLDSFNIPTTVSNEHVGRNLKDHSTIYISVEVPSSVPTMDLILRNRTLFQRALNAYQAGAGGQLDTANTDFLGFQRLSDAELRSMGAEEFIEFGSDWPNLEYLIAPEYLNPGFPNPPNATGHYLTITVVLLTQSSAGEVTIASNDLLDPPVVDVKYLDTEVDRKLAVLGFKYGMRLAQSAAFSLISLENSSIFPPPDTITTDEKILEYIKASMGTIWHASSTAAMGSVVDSELAVYGVDRLRVVDASVQPVLSNAHVQATVYMIAEKAAHIIKMKYGI